MEEEIIYSLTKRITLEGISKYAKNRLKQSVPFQILDLILPKERWIRSIIGGLETGLGTTLWQPLAKEFAQKNGFQVHDPKQLKKPIDTPSEISSIIDSIISSRSKGESKYLGERAKNTIKKTCLAHINYPLSTDRFEDPPKGRGVDVWIQKENVDYLFDIKTVRPNISGFHSYLRQILSWYYYYFSKYPDSNIHAKIAFPYNPFRNKTFWEGSMGRGKPLDQSFDAMVENEFWDFLTGNTETFQIMKRAFIDLQKEGFVSEEITKLLDTMGF